jgi:hypothetical protein
MHGMRKFVLRGLFVSAVFFSFVACPGDISKINGVFYSGSAKPEKEFFMLSQVYLQTPQQGFYPSEFKWNLLNGTASLNVFNPDNLDAQLQSYSFQFDPSWITVRKNADKMTYSASLRAKNNPTVWMVLEVEDYPATLVDEKYHYNFDRRDFDLSFVKNGQFIGFFKGAQMSLTGLVPKTKKEEEI